MQDPDDPKARRLTAFRSAARTVETKAAKAELKDDEQSWDNEGGHMSSTAGRVMHVPGASLPYLVVLAHHGSGPTERSFPTMREAEAFIKRNTPQPGQTLSAIYDRPAQES